MIVVHGDKEQEHRDFATRVALRVGKPRPVSKYLCDLPLPDSADAGFEDDNIRLALAQEWNGNPGTRWPEILVAMATDPRPIVFSLGFGNDAALRFEKIKLVLDYWNNWAAGPGAGSSFRPVILLCVNYDPAECRPGLKDALRLLKLRRIRVRLERMPLEGYLGRLDVNRLDPLPNVTWTQVNEWAKRRSVKDYFGPAHGTFVGEVSSSLGGDFRGARRGLPMQTVVTKLVRIKVRIP